MQQHLPFFGLHTLAKLPHCKSSPPHLNWLLAAPACGAIDSNISAADSVTISIRMIWLPSPQCTALSLSSATTLRSPNTEFEFNMHFCEGSLTNSRAASFAPTPGLAQARAPSGPAARKRRACPEFDSDQGRPGLSLLCCNRDGLCGMGPLLFIELS